MPTLESIIRKYIEVKNSADEMKVEREREKAMKKQRYQRVMEYQKNISDLMEAYKECEADFEEKSLLEDDDEENMETLFL